MASISKRINKNGTITYRAVIRKKGFKEIFCSFKDENVARQWAEQQENEINLERVYKKLNRFNPNEKKVDPHLFCDLLERYCSEYLSIKKDGKHRLSHINYWREEFKDCLLEEVTTEKIEHCLKQLSTKISIKNKKRLTPNTIKHYLASLSHFFTIAMKQWKFIDHHPVQAVHTFRGNSRIGSYREKKITWTKLKDMYPDIDTAVLVCNEKSGFMTTACYNQKNGGNHWEGFIFCNLLEFKPTHWMPLPELPKDS